jgi:phospholipase/carboxylesterase
MRLPSLAPMRCARHDLALASDGTCILCRRAVRRERPPSPWASVARLLALLIAPLCVGAVLVVGLRRRSTAGASAAPDEVPSSRIGELRATNSSNRTGAYLLPMGFVGHAVPLLVAIHGTGGRGAQMVSLFRAEAEREGFIVVAPDSRAAPNGQFTWQVGDTVGEITEDVEHIRRCIAEVRAMAGVRIDVEHVLVAGHSGGGSTAPYVATNDDLFTAFAVLHGGAFPGGFGSHPVRGWFSTGSADLLRSPARVRQAALDAKPAVAGQIIYREFAGGHDVSELEASELIRWWLHPPGSQAAVADAAH